MNHHHIAALTCLVLLLLPAAQAQGPGSPVTLRYHFAAGQRVRYLVQRDPYFADPARAMEAADPDAPYRPPVVERLTEEVRAAGRDGTATVRMTLEAARGFEDEARPEPTVTRTLTVTAAGRVLTPAQDVTDRVMREVFVPLPDGPVRPGARWDGGGEEAPGRLALAAVRAGGPGLAVITRDAPPAVRESRSPDHDGTLLQTTRRSRSDRMVFDLGAGQLVRQRSVMAVTVSLTMTGRGARGADDFGHVIPTVRVEQTLTVERRDGPPDAR